MTRVPIFRPEAEAEALEARRWYEGRRLGLGDEFGAAVDATVARIVERPFAFPQVRGETRRAVLTRFPDALYFRVTDESIVVLAVHGRQNPSRWQRRAKLKVDKPSVTTRGPTGHAADGAVDRVRRG